MNGEKEPQEEASREKLVALMSERIDKFVQSSKRVGEVWRREVETPNLIHRRLLPGSDSYISLKILEELLGVSETDKVHVSTKVFSGREELIRKIIVQSADDQGYPAIYARTNLEGIILEEFLEVDNLLEHISAVQSWSGIGRPPMAKHTAVAYLVRGNIQEETSERPIDKPKPGKKGVGQKINDFIRSKFGIDFEEEIYYRLHPFDWIFHDKRK